MSLASNGKLVAFVPSTDLARSRTFYESVLGLTIEEVSPFALVARSGGTTLRITPIEGMQALPFTVLGWTVEDIHAELAVLRGAGVEPMRPDGIDQDDAGVWIAPGGTQVAWFHDPDSNVLSLTQH